VSPIVNIRAVNRNPNFADSPTLIPGAHWSVNTKSPGEMPRLVCRFQVHSYAATLGAARFADLTAPALAGGRNSMLLRILSRSA
jgi:hypothetical protein